MTKIKCCGLTRDCDIEYANALLPDYIGFVFAKDRRRYIAPESAAKLRKKLKDTIISVGVFVNEEIDEVCDVVNAGVVDMIQLHGTENEEYITKLRARVNVPIIKAFRITCEEDVLNAERSSADYILLDNGIGGTGSAFDWSFIKNVKRPFFLAGGITSDNVSEALTMRPYALDVSSGIETDGYKDFEKMQQLIDKVRKE